MSNLEEARRDELLTAALQGIFKSLKTMRGATLFGSKATCKVVGNGIQVTTYQAGVNGPINYELNLFKR